MSIEMEQWDHCASSLTMKLCSKKGDLTGVHISKASETNVVKRKPEGH